MSRADRIVKRHGTTSFEKVLKKNGERLKDPVYVEQLRKMGFPECPNCKLPMTGGYGDSTGDYDLCEMCGTTTPVIYVEDELE